MTKPQQTSGTRNKRACSPQRHQPCAKPQDRFRLCLRCIEYALKFAKVGYALYKLWKVVSEHWP